MADTKRSTGGTDQPITRHPLFPAIVALWFGAIAGLGSVVVSPTTIEGIVLALGIDKVIPMAAPPLGTTMRILLALGMTGVGAAIGGVVARRIARPAETDAATDAVEGIAEADAAPAGRRRRALAIEPDAAVAPLAVPETAPVPGGPEDTRILNVAEFDINSFDEPTAPEVPFRRPAETTAETDSVDAAAEDEELPAWFDTESAWHEEEKPVPQEFHRGALLTPTGAQIFRVELENAEQEQAAPDDDTQDKIGRLFDAYSRKQAEDAASQGEVESDVVRPGFTILPRMPQGDWSAHNDVDEPVAETSVEDQHDDAEESVWAAAVPPFAAPIAEEQEAPAPFTQPSFIASHEHVEAEAAEVEAEPVEYAPFEIRSASDRIIDADLGTLSQVELLERLALAMQRRREDARLAAEEAALAPQPAPEPLAAPFSAPFAAPVIEQAPTTDHGFVETSFDEPEGEPNWTAEIPDALRPIALDPIDDLDEPLPGYTPLRHIGLAANADAEAIPFPNSPFAADPEEVEEDSVLQQGYSSLLNLSRAATARKPFLQFSEPDEAGDDIAHSTPALVSEETIQPAPFGRPVLLPDPTGEAPQEPQERPFDAPRNDPDASERALREALATLQRMSGAA